VWVYGSRDNGARRAVATMEGSISTFDDPECASTPDGHVTSIMRHPAARRRSSQIFRSNSASPFGARLIHECHVTRCVMSFPVIQSIISRR
jgi:hypothetical protein